MASITIRNIDESLKTELRLAAAENNRSMEEEVRQILKHFLLVRKSSAGIGTRISQRFAQAGGVELPEIHRSLPGRVPGFAAEDKQ